MLIKLTGHGGVGKLTIGRILASMVVGRLVDNHTIYNPAFAITDFRSSEFFDTVRSVRALIFRRAAAQPSDVAIIFTFAPGPDPDWDAEWDQAFRELASERREPLLAVTLICSPEEHRRRIVSPTRALLLKLTSTNLIDDGLLHPEPDKNANRTMVLDVTSLAPEHAARKIADWALNQAA